MDMYAFNPHYKHPFTFSQAVHLDPATITAEIARLQGSLARLKQTQEELKEFVDQADAPDREIQEALHENDTVISSQEERIVMLRLALEKQGGVLANNPHYARTSGEQLQSRPGQSEPQAVRHAAAGDEDEDEGNGVYL